MEQELEYIIQIINYSENFSAKEFNFNSEVRKVYCLIYDENSLLEAIERETLLEANRIYYIDHALKSFIEKNKIAIELANKYINEIQNYYTRNWLKIDLVKQAVDESNIELAEQISSEIPDEESGPGQYLAHRNILEYYASIGDIENFKNKIKKSKLGKFPRYGIETWKYKLIEGIAKKNGIDNAFNIIEEKYFEKTSAIAILRWAAHKLSIEEIESYLNKYPRILAKNETARAELYVLHFREQDNKAIPQNIFDKTLNEILKVDKDAKWGDLRFRDSLLIDLGASTLYKDQAIECKKHIVSPRAKRELNYSIKYKMENKKYIS